MLELRPLKQDQYKQVAEWEYGPQENVDWPRYYAEMNAPGWYHLGVYSGAEFVGCVSFEQINRHIMAYHVVTARRKVQPQALADLLLSTTPFFFRRGFTALTVTIPIANVAAARLAIRCGMKELKAAPAERHFILMRGINYG